MIADHLGKEYKSLSAMCNTYGVKISTFKSRIRRGWKLKDALTIPADIKNQNRKALDHFGVSYRNGAGMCHSYGINQSTFYTRISANWGLEQALTTPIFSPREKVKIRDHIGNRYKTIEDMCYAWKIRVNRHERLKKAGYSLEEILTKKFTKYEGCVLDHEGHRYLSKLRMCKHYGISLKEFKKRIELNWTLRKALTTPEGEVVDHLGTKFSDVESMCKAWGTDKIRLETGLKEGKSMKEMLTNGNNKVVDKDGVIYKDMKEFFEVHGKPYLLYGSWSRAGLSLEEMAIRKVVVKA